VIPQSELTARRLVDEVTGLVNDPVKLKRMGLEAKNLAHEDAAGRVVDLAESLIE